MNKLKQVEEKAEIKKSNISLDHATVCHITAETAKPLLGTMCPSIRHKSTGPKCSILRLNFEYTFCKGPCGKFHEFA